MPEQRKKTPCGIGLMAHVTAGVVQRHIIIQSVEEPRFKENRRGGPPCPPAEK